MEKYMLIRSGEIKTRNEWIKFASVHCLDSDSVLTAEEFINTTIQIGEKLILVDNHEEKNIINMLNEEMKYWHSLDIAIEIVSKKTKKSKHAILQIYNSHKLELV